MISEVFDIKIGDVVSVTGSGGKTTFVNKLSYEFPGKRVLVTTSTKMKAPKSDEYDFIFDGVPPVVNRSGRYFLCSGNLLTDGKAIGLEPDALNEIVEKFDVSLIESDGSKTKPLKGWRENEPVVISKTTKTVGIINLKLLGQEITEQNVHRNEIYKYITGDDKVTLNGIKKIILHKNGLFKNCVGKKLLFINQIDQPFEAEIVKELLQSFERQEADLFYKIICGSLLKGEYKIWL